MKIFSIILNTLSPLQQTTREVAFLHTNRKGALRSHSNKREKREFGEGFSPQKRGFKQRWGFNTNKWEKL